MICKCLIVTALKKVLILGPFIRGKIRRELYHLYEHVLSNKTRLILDEMCRLYGKYASPVRRVLFSSYKWPYSFFFRTSSEDWFSCKFFVCWLLCPKISLWYFVDNYSEKRKEKVLAVLDNAIIAILTLQFMDIYLCITTLLRRTHKTGQLF